MTNRIPSAAMAYAINEERGQWLPNNSSPEARAYIGEALDRLARNLAKTLHPDHQSAFLARSGTTEN